MTWESKYYGWGSIVRYEKIKRFLMKKPFRNITSVRKDLVIILFVAISVIFLIDFVLSDIPEIFKGGAKLGIIIYRLCQITCECGRLYSF